MANFPNSLDSLTNPASTDGLNSPDHATQHATANDILEALEAKIGVDNSAVATSLDYFLKHASGAYRTHKHDGTSDDGAKLDWDDVWTDAVHSHASDGEGGNIPEASVDFDISAGHDHDGVDSKLLAPPTVKAKQSVVQEIPNSTITVLDWGAEDWDTDTMHDNSTNNSRLTVNTAGKYLVTLNVIWESNNTGARQLLIFQNTTQICGVIFPNNGAGQDQNQIFMVANAIVTDYFVAKVWHAAGVAIDAGVTLGDTYFTATRIAT